MVEKIIALEMTEEGKLLTSERPNVHLNLQNAHLKNNGTVLFQIVVLHIPARITVEEEVRNGWALDLHLAVPTNKNMKYSV